MTIILQTIKFNQNEKNDIIALVLFSLTLVAMIQVGILLFV